MTQTGKCKWWSEKKGFGFITGDDGKEVFCHYTGIVGQAGKKNLLEGQKVEFQVESSPRGPRAVQVIPEQVY